jgi:hypothetical protein
MESPSEPRFSLSDLQGMTLPSSTSMYVHVDLEDLDKRSQPPMPKRIPKKPIFTIDVARPPRQSGRRSLPPCRTARPKTARRPHAADRPPDRDTVTEETRKYIERVGRTSTGIAPIGSISATATEGVQVRARQKRGTASQGRRITH